ncbi:helix-turn-helix domain-containing protein [Minwuia thermotolerans]|uniref:HTH cro/C1-type domain-containing protein n=1 Tax=Minwuia thermotolerans TaxID=2056226 RepID=A0A2M9G2T8_9PROT|nr:helix-turn-helix domain-containing protein [Minwuia thermotolerans]PJK30004.1 hypothetical protein CVT23_09585 [Minwuia thermotolerans]
MSNRFENDRNSSDEASYNIDDTFAEGRYTGIGAELKAERLRCGLSLEDVSQRLRIRVQHLHSIEEGRFGDLPGRIYALGFVRSYAEFLGADGDVCVRIFKDEVGPDGHSRRLSFPTPPIENRRPGMMTLAVSLLLGALVYGGWYVYSNEGDRLAETVPAVPERFVEQSAPASRSSDSIVGANASERPAEDRAESDVVTAETFAAGDAPAEDGETAAEAGNEPPTNAEAPAPETSASVETTPNETTTIAEATAAAQTAEDSTASDGQGSAAASDEAPAGGETVDAATPPDLAAAEPEPVEVAPAPAQETTETASVTAEPAAPAAVSEDDRLARLTPPPLPPSARRDGYVPRVFGITNRDARIVVRAVAPAQIIVKQSGGRTLLPHRMMQPGDSYRVPDTRGVILESENIDNLEIFLDGKSIGSAGVLAAPARALALTPEILRSLAR